MRAIIIVIALCVSSATVAQELPPPPADPLLTADEIETVKAALAKIKAQGLDVNYTVVEHLSSAVGPTQLPMVGFALSRSSDDPKACALLKRIEPSAVCMVQVK